MTEGTEGKIKAQLCTLSSGIKNNCANWYILVNLNILIKKKKKKMGPELKLLQFNRRNYFSS